MNLNIIEYLKKADQDLCPLISLEVSCNMLNHDEIRYLPSHYKRLSCKKILNFVGDDPNFMIISPIERKVMPLNELIYNLIDNGFKLGEIGQYLENYDKTNINIYPYVKRFLD